MPVVDGELRAFTLRRRRALVELALSLAAWIALIALAPGVEAAPAEAKVVYLGLLVLCAARAALSVAGLLPVLLFHCPRCRERFHGGRELRRRLRTAWRACVHCGLASRREA